MSYETNRHIGIVKSYQEGWSREVNIVKWEYGRAVYDIRDWNENHEQMTRGLTFTEEEARKLYEILKEEFDRKDCEEDARQRMLERGMSEDEAERLAPEVAKKQKEKFSEHDTVWDIYWATFDRAIEEVK